MSVTIGRLQLTVFLAERPTPLAIEPEPTVACRRAERAFRHQCRMKEVNIDRDRWDAETAFHWGRCL